MPKPEICKECPAYKDPGPVWSDCCDSTMGCQDPQIILVGEAPGEEELDRGKGFVGTSGRLLWAMAARVGVHRSKCHVTNVAKCNTKHPRAFKFCYDRFLKEELELHPDVPVLLMGRPARDTVLPQWAHISMEDMRGTRVGRFMVALHPAFLRRTGRVGDQDSGGASTEKQDLTPTLASDIAAALE